MTGENESSQLNESERLNPDQVLVQRLKTEFGVDSDLSLAKRLNIPSTTLGRVTRGDAKFTWGQRFIIRDKLGFAAVRNAIAGLLPESLSESFIEASHRQFLRVIEQERHHEQPQEQPQEQNYAPSSSAKLINLLQSIVLPGFSETLTELARIRRPSEIIEAGDLSLDERALIIQTLYRQDPKLWLPLIEHLRECVATTEELYVYISLKVGDANSTTHKTNSLIDVVANKFGLASAGDIAVALGISASALSKARTGQAKLPPRAAFKLHCLLSSETLDAAEASFLETDCLLEDSTTLISYLNGNKNN